MPKTRKRKWVDEQELDPSILAKTFARLHEKKIGTEISEIKIRIEEMPYILKYLKLNNIETLTIEASAKLDEAASLLANIDTLQSLTLNAISSNQPIHRGLIGLASHRSLTKLVIRSSKISVEGIAAILKNNVLTHLTLNAVIYREFKQVSSILSHPTLPSLSLIGYIINSNDCNFFFKNKTLKQLSLQGSCIDDKGIQILSKHPTITDLTLVERSFALNITLNGIKSLVKNTFLQGVHLISPSSVDKIMGDKIINILANHSSLIKLTLRQCNISSKSVNSLLSRPLTYLDLSKNSDIDNEAAYTLSTFLSLRCLNLKACNVSDEGAIALAGHLNLTDLNLMNNPIHLLGICALICNSTIRNLSIPVSYRILPFGEICSISSFFIGNKALHHINKVKEVDDIVGSPNELTSRNIGLQNQYDQEVVYQLENVYEKRLPSPIIKIVQEYTEGEYPYDYGLFRKAITTQERYIQIKESISQIRTQLKTVKEPKKLDQFITEIDKQLNTLSFQH